MNYAFVFKWQYSFLSSKESENGIKNLELAYDTAYKKKDTVEKLWSFYCNAQM